MNIILGMLLLVQVDSSNMMREMGLISPQMRDPDTAGNQAPTYRNTIKENISECMTITREEIEKDGARTVFEVLRNCSGLHFVQEGPFGGVTYLHLRGTKPGHTLVLIDGVKVNDPSSPDRSFDWGTLPTAAVERIEVIRGTLSALYGSDAMGGVINIITKGGRNPANAGQKGVVPEGSFYTGSFWTFEENGGVSGGTEHFDYSVSLFNASSKGISKAIVDTGDRDGFTNTGAYTKVNFLPSNKLAIGFAGGIRKATISLDKGQFNDDLNASALNTSGYGSIFFRQGITDLWHYEFTLGLNKINREHYDKKQTRLIDEDSLITRDESYKGEYMKEEWKNNFNFNKYVSASAGVEYAKESGGGCNCGASDTPWRVPTKSIENSGFYIEIKPEYRNLSFTWNERLDTYRYFGNYNTWHGAIAWVINSTRFKGDYGTGFKVPTIYQLFAPDSGNPELKPEEIYGYNVIGEHKFENGSVEVIYFNHCIKKLIYLNSDSGKYINRPGSWHGNWWNEGLEFILLLNITKDWSMDIQYTGIDKGEGSKEEDYFNVPVHNYKWSINYKWLNFKFCCIGRRYDMDCDNVKVDLYSCRKIDVTTLFNIKGVKLEARIENLINESYMEKFGYGTVGRSFYVGIAY